MKKTSLITLVVIVFYTITHLYGLLTLPVFADEAIYIRWAQLIIDDWQRYLFFPLNDGKTPLFIWLMVPFQFMFENQLWAGRFVSVVAGLGQTIATGYLIKILGGRPKTQWLGMILTSILPFWFFHHRMALIDGLLTVCLTLLVIGLVKLSQLSIPKKLSYKQDKYIRNITLLTGLAFGLTLWIKFPAILFLPLFGFLPLITARKKISEYLPVLFLSGMAAVIGLFLFVLLRLTPVFGQLFSRGGDFLYPWHEVLLQGKWQVTLSNSVTYARYFWQYLTWPILVLSLMGLFSKQHQRTHHLLWLGFWSFVFPIALFGKVVYPRYFFPSALFLTVSATLSIQEWVDYYINSQKKLGFKILNSIVLIFMLTQTIAFSSLFMTTAWINPNAMPFVSADKSQYLYDWSSGHGIEETVEFIRTQKADHSLAVATEGSFGTLPDGLTLRFHRQDVSNLYIDGIGQPVVQINPAFKERAQAFDQVILVVNSHRMKLNLPQTKLLRQYCRPDNAPCLQIWDITEIVKNNP